MSKIKKPNVVTLVAKLIPPQLDKGWSFQATGFRGASGVTEDQVWAVRAAFKHPDVVPTRPFLQGNSGGWIMVEFWTDNKKDIDAAAAHFFKLFNLPFKEGDFTREELGL